MGADGKSLWQKVSSIASSITSIFENHQVTITNIIGVVLAFGGEWFIEENGYFSCPCTKELAMNYGLSFILGGAIILWMIGFMVYSQTWKACHGCSHMPWEKEICCIYWSFFFTACVKTIIIPLAWVFALLLDGDYIACILSADSCEEESEEYKKLKRLSQLSGFWSLCGLLILVCFVRCISRCFNKKNYLHYTLSEAYRSAEEEALFKSIPEVADSLAKGVVSSFLEKKDLKEEDWSAATNENQNLGTFFSPLHKFVEVRKYAQVPLVAVQPDTKV